MPNFFENFMQSSPHALADVRASLEKAAKDDRGFIDVLKDHHDYLDESISVLLDRNASDNSKQVQLIRFFKLLEMHGRAEQETLYPQLRQNEDMDVRLEGYVGKDEHDIAFQLEDELLQMGYLTTWNEVITAKAKVVATLVKNHIKEEESTMFPLAEQTLSEEELLNLRDEYLQKCKIYLEEVNDFSEESSERESSEPPSLHS